MATKIYTQKLYGAVRKLNFSFGSSSFPKELKKKKWKNNDVKIATGLLFGIPTQNNLFVTNAEPFTNKKFGGEIPPFFYFLEVSSD